jgi:hypothetical protein
MRHSLPMTWAAALAISAAGCGQGGDGLPRQAISGTVKIDGRPLDTGEITFAPNVGDGPAVGGKIANGAYSIRRADGPVPGPHNVAIFSAMPTGKKIKDDVDPKVTYDERVETIPERYNARTQLKAEVEMGGANRFDFALAGRKDPTRTKR